MKKTTIEEIDQANNAFQAYIKENGLLNTYQGIARGFSNPPSSIPKTPTTPADRLGVGSKSQFVINGPADDIILIYNATSSAPSVSKNLRGDILFQDSAASVCFSQGTPDATLGRYIERLLSQQGAIKVTRGPDPCDLAKASTSIDIIAFQRGELLKQSEAYIGALVKGLEDGGFRQYRIVTDYRSTLQKLEAFSLQIETEVENNSRQGYGVLATSEADAVCIITPQQAEKVDGIKLLLGREKDVVAPKLTAGWQFVDATADLAYLGLQRQQCGYVAGEANSLRTIMLALRGDKRKYRFSPVWFDAQEVAQATFDARDEREQEIRKRAEDQRKLEEAKKIADQLKRDSANQNGAMERLLRQQYGAQARSYRE